MKFFTLALFTTCWIPVLEAQEASTTKNDSTKSYTTARVVGTPPQIDGLLDDAAWEQVPWGGGDFRQNQPDAGAPASVITKFKILYDAKNLYLAFKCYDPEPDKIVRRMSRRDGFDGDFVEINIDSYYDRRSAFSFTSSVSGVKGDEYVSNNGDNWDTSWDPIWYLKTTVDAEGWVAEVRIPLSQLRFADKEEHVWGFQIMRHFFRNQERSLFQYIPPNAPGWVHLFADLKGITGIKPQKQVEIQPYVVAKTERYEKEPGNPFATGKSSEIEAGLDAKIGLTSDITLDLTVNPDFGQVEADPSQVNLSAFQLFFSERRPFFIEGRNTLNFPVTESIAGGNFNSDNLFYSRRIGKRPSYSPELNDGEFAKIPVNTKIAVAAKLTGKNRHGLSWGILESRTKKTEAEISIPGPNRRETVEPRTNFLVGRIQQDINKGNTIVGAMFTATNRHIEDEDVHLSNFLHKEAYTGGLDFTHNWKDRKYYFKANGVFSNVRGTKEAILNTQTANEHLFHRPKASHVSVDSSATSLSGHGGSLSAGKSSGNFVYQGGVTWRSPGVELNDAGFLISADLITQWAWAQYRILKPFAIFRSLRVNGNQWLYFDFEGVNTRRMINFNGHTQFKNFWFTGTGFTLIDRRIANADLRGGPPITYPGGLENWYYIETDNRKKLRGTFENWFFTGFHESERSKGISASITYRPINALNISIAPNIDWNDNRQQYVTDIDYNDEKRFITARIKQTTLNITIRANYVLTPNLTIEYWGQPFISRGEYSEFKRITDADASEYTDRFHTFTNTEIAFNAGEYDVDEDANGSVDYSFDNPNFNFAQFRSNMVLRWEYIPGSTFFLVWTQNRSDVVPLDERNSFRHLASSLIDRTPHNIFLVKYTYRFRM